MRSAITPDQEVVSRRVEGDIHRTTYRELAARSRRMANAIGRLGVTSGDRIGTLAWNGYRHMELYYAVSGSGAVLHTLNPRLHPDHIVYIATHAEDSLIFFDMTFLPIVEAVASRLPGVKAFIALTDRAHMPQESKVANLLCYETCSTPNRMRSNGRASTRTRPLRSATPRARRATRRACSQPTARPCFTPSRSRCPMRSTARRAT